MADVVRYKVREGVALITVDNPPVNALTQPVRAGLMAALAEAAADPAVGAVVIQAQGRTFPAGADVRDFRRQADAPELAEVCAAVEDCPKPVIAAVHGTALGGGLELALAAHARLAHVGAQFGFPEVALGMVPTAGGSQRLARLAGAEVALEMLVGGKPVSADWAERHGLVDKVIQKNLGKAAFGSARNVAEAGARPRPTRAREEGLADPAGYIAAVRARRAGLAGDPRAAVHAAVDLVEAALLLPFEAGLAMERTRFEDLVDSPQARGLRHAFLAERRTTRLPELAGVPVRSVARVGVVGGGRLGAGIARAVLAAGLRVVLVERDAAAAAAARARIEAGIDRDLARHRFGAGRRDAQLAYLACTDSLAAVAECDIVIEAIAENAEAKRALFAALGGVARPGAILATTAAHLDPRPLAVASGRAADVIGLRFVPPAHRVRLVEVVPMPGQAADLAGSAVHFARVIGKVPVLPGAGGAGLALPLFDALLRAAKAMLLEGATPAAVDAAMRGFGFPLGPFEMADLAGLDRLRPPQGGGAPMRLVERMVARGWTGQAAGQGFYRYAPGSTAGSPAPGVEGLIEAIRQEAGLRPRAVPAAEIEAACSLALVNAGARLVEAGIARKPSDVDATMLLGFGFPRWRGGPMEMADQAGLLATRARLRALAGEGHRALWAPGRLIDELIKYGRDFDSLNGADGGRGKPR